MMVVLAFIGTTLSRQVLERITDTSFRQWTRWTVMTLGTVYLGGNWVLVLCPEHVTIFKKEGWTKAQIREAVYERAVRPLSEFKRIAGHPDSAISAEDAGVAYHYLQTPEDLLIVTAGGKAGGFSAVIPPWAAADSRPVTRAVGVCIDCD